LFARAQRSSASWAPEAVYARRRRFARAGRARDDRHRGHPLLTGRAVDEIGRGDKDGLATFVGLIGIMALLRLGLSVMRRLVAGRVSLAVEVDLRNRDLRPPAGARAGVLRNDADGAADVARHRRPAIRPLLPRLRADLHRQSALTILLAAVAMFVLQPGLAALALFPVPFVVLVAARYGRRSRPALQEVQQRIAELTADVEENVSGIRVVKAFAAEPRQLARFRARSDAYSSSR
jgi:ATP-binding cassette subfamily B protein